VKLAVMNSEGKELRKLDVDESVFGIEPNASVLHQAYVIQRNNQRWGTAQTKTRGEVQGSTRKIRRQKYTGRARAGAESSPTRVGGGTIFGPRRRDYSQVMPKKMRRLAIRSALSGKAADGQLVVIDSLTFGAPKTKEIMRILANVGINRSVLIVTGEPDRHILASARNLMKTKVLPARYLNVGDMLNHQRLLMTEEAVKIAESLWAVAAPEKPAKKTTAKAAVKSEPRRSRGKAGEGKEEAAPAEAQAETTTEAKPGRRTRFVAKTEDATDESTEKAEATTEAPAEEKKPARRARAPKAEAGEEKPKRASRAKAPETKDDEKPKTPRKRTTKKTDEGEG
jgi:large subunit ribosomal protein L4